MLNEIWVDVPGYEGVYYISSLGRIKNAKGIFLSFSREEYLKVQLWKNGQYKTFRVHRLVWEAFNGPIPKGMQINHLNENKLDNRLDNLSLVSPSQNHRWGTCIERSSKGHYTQVNQLDMDGTFVQTWSNIKEAAAELHISRGHITEVCQGKRKTAGNGKERWRWEYV